MSAWPLAGAQFSTGRLVGEKRKGGFNAMKLFVGCPNQIILSFSLLFPFRKSKVVISWSHTSSEPYLKALVAAAPLVFCTDLRLSGLCISVMFCLSASALFYEPFTFYVYGLWACFGIAPKVHKSIHQPILLVKLNRNIKYLKVSLGGFSFQENTVLPGFWGLVLRNENSYRFSW